MSQKEKQFRETVAVRIGGGKRERLLLPGETLAEKKFGEFGALRFYDIQSSTCWMSPELVIPKPSGRIYVGDELPGKKRENISAL
ncbi:hypothetical protein CDAR_36911 [Caerostris darwini]|uniref:Uncharacterized protein n=1 Tax=Caerostris darwini TaxID=1538125 RepID=A0AAV4UVL1_9ARAC|nr:hypothetical protein CDAR_36911 [Caerostris darwini]